MVKYSIFAGPWPRACQIMSLWTFVSTVVSTLSISIFVLVFSSQRFSASHSFFCNNSAIQSVFCTKFEPSPFFSAKISNSASTVARTTVSCLNSAHARLLLREPPGIGIGWSLSLAGHLFLKHVLKRLFSGK